jgi:hypothetical protein
MRGALRLHIDHIERLIHIKGSPKQLFEKQGKIAAEPAVLQDRGQR